MVEQVTALAGSLRPAGGGEETLLEGLCRAACARLDGRLKDGITPEDCGEAYVTAAAWLALAGLDRSVGVKRFSAGDLTVETAAEGHGLEEQAWALMEPYLRDGGFAFRGVPG